MPSAPDDMRARWGDEDAETYLHARGYTSDADFNWRHPTITEPNQKDWDAIDYMELEWDYGNFIANED